MNKKLVKYLNSVAKKRKHGSSKVKVFQASTNYMRVLKEEG